MLSQPGLVCLRIHVPPQGACRTMGASNKARCCMAL
jgi:hypothetical protein